MPYDEDLAYIHEIGFGDVARAAAREVQTRLPPPARIVDLGCGGGSLAAELGRRYDVWGCDLSESMVQLARRRAPHARFDVGDALGIKIPACQGVTMVGEILNYALADRALAAADNFVSRVHSALAPGGLFLFDVATTGKAQGERTATRKGRDWSVEAHVVVDGDRLTRTITTRRTVGDAERATTEVHRQRLLDANWVTAILEDAGFHVDLLGGYDDHPFQEGWDAFAATKSPV